MADADQYLYDVLQRRPSCVDGSTLRQSKGLSLSLVREVGPSHSHGRESQSLHFHAGIFAVNSGRTWPHPPHRKRPISGRRRDVATRSRHAARSSCAPFGYRVGDALSLDVELHLRQSRHHLPHPGSTPEGPPTATSAPRRKRACSASSGQDGRASLRPVGRKVFVDGIDAEVRGR